MGLGPTGVIGNGGDGEKRKEGECWCRVAWGGIGEKVRFRKRQNGIWDLELTRRTTILKDRTGSGRWRGGGGAKAWAKFKPRVRLTATRTGTSNGVVKKFTEAPGGR